MRETVGSVLVAVLMGGFAVGVAQLPPEIVADSYLVRAERLMAEKDYEAALDMMDKIVALQREHDLTLPEEFHFKHAQVSFSAGSIQAALKSVNHYLAAAGTGKVDLLLGGDGKLELLDFRISPRPKDSPELIAAYECQLCTYARILERRHGRHVDRLLLYWTSEARKEDALMVLQYDPGQVEGAGHHFDETVRRIQSSEFTVTTPPEAAICKQCDLRMLGHAEGIISRETWG